MYHENILPKLSWIIVLLILFTLLPACQSSQASSPTGTAAVGYGYEYVASTLDRVRLAALAQSDADLQMPIVSPVSTDTWGVKESSATEEDEPAWGCQEERAIEMEVSTAAANLTGGADAVIMRHPAAIATIKKFITELV